MLKNHWKLILTIALGLNVILTLALLFRTGRQMDSTGMHSTNNDCFGNNLNLQYFRDQVSRLERIEQQEVQEQRSKNRPIKYDLTVVVLGDRVVKDALQKANGSDVGALSDTERNNHVLNLFRPYYKSHDDKNLPLQVQVLPSFDYSENAIHELNLVLQSKVSTTHVLIMDPRTRLPRQNIADLKSTNLTRLVESLNHDGVDIVGTVMFNSRTRVMSTPCFRFYHHMWQLSHERYQLGYDVHQGHSIYCERTSNTFAARTDILRRQLGGLDSKMTRLVFVDLQFRAAQLAKGDSVSAVYSGTNPFVMMEHDGIIDDHINALTKAFAVKHQVELFIDAALQKHEHCIIEGLRFGGGLLIPYCYRKHEIAVLHIIHDFWTRNGTEMDSFGLYLLSHKGTSFGAARNEAYNLYDVDIDIGLFGPDAKRTKQRLNELQVLLRNRHAINILDYNPPNNWKMISGKHVWFDVEVLSQRPLDRTAFIEFESRKYHDRPIPMFLQYVPHVGNALEIKMHFHHAPGKIRSQCLMKGGHNACAPNCIHNGTTGMHANHCTFDYRLPEYVQPPFNQRLSMLQLTQA